MNKGIMLALFGVLLVGSAFALPQNASNQLGATGNYTRDIGNTTVVTEGGNVTELNLSRSVSTEKWAGFYGNVTGGLRLAQGVSAAPMYVWGWNISTGGEVCATTGFTFGWANVLGATATGIDQLWGFAATDVDSAVNTFLTTGQISLTGATVNPVTGASTWTYNNESVNTWETVALNDTATPASKDDIAFCVNMSPSNVRWDAVTGGYQLMVATNETAGTTETYYFFVELNA